MAIDETRLVLTETRSAHVYCRHGPSESGLAPRSLQPRACAFANRPLARVERRRLENFLCLQQILNGANLSQLFYLIPNPYFTEE